MLARASAEEIRPIGALKPAELNQPMHAAPSARKRRRPSPRVEALSGSLARVRRSPPGLPSYGFHELLKEAVQVRSSYPRLHSLLTTVYQRFARSALTEAEHEITYCESRQATMTATTSPSQSSFMPPAEPYGSARIRYLGLEPPARPDGAPSLAGDCRVRPACVDC